MKSSILFSIVFLVALTPSLQAQQAAGFEEPPILSAAAILRPEFVAGPNFTVRDAVPTLEGRNRYLIDSEYGTFEADGNAMLLRRVREIYAIARLRDVSRTDEYKKAVVAAAKSPLLLAKGLIENPVGTISGVPKGLWKFVNRTGTALKQATEGVKRNEYEDSGVEQIIGFSKVKRDVAIQLGVDPYSSNETLQRELNGVCWAAFAGKMTLTLATIPVGGTVGLAITATNVSTTLDQALRDRSPADLRLDNNKRLLEMGCNPAQADAFLNNPAISPSVQTGMVLNLMTLANVANIGGFVQLAATGISEEGGALFFLETTRLLSLIHTNSTPLARIDAFEGLPIALTKDDRVAVVLEWDYASWTARAADFVERVMGAKYGSLVPKGVVIGISGDASPMTRQRLGLLGVQLATRLAPGPLL